MNHRLSFDHTPKELASRHSGTTEVALLWSRRKRRAAVAVLDEATGEYFELAIGERDDPLDLFDHPFAYAAARGLATASTAPAKRAA
ncbi:MAG: hypothetical protein ACXVZ2_02935 [Gaiellaceae bacterium]